MLTEKNPERKERMPGMEYRAMDDVAPVEIEEPEVPKALTEVDAQEAQEQALELVARLQEASGSRELALLDGISNVGTELQRTAGGHLDLLKTRMGTFLNEGGTSEAIAKGLGDLRVTLNRINPDGLTNPGIGQRIVAVLPFTGGRTGPLVRALNKVALRYEPVSRQVAPVGMGKRAGRHDDLRPDSR